MALTLSYQLMTEAQITQALNRMADEALRSNGGRDVVLIGIQRRGVPMANRMADHVSRVTGHRPDVGILDINMYRDDLSLVAEQPVLRKTEVPVSIEGKDIVLTDDVLYTGRTVRSALNALYDIGRARSIQLAVLVDRGHRELPIEANFIGQKIATKDSEVVEVKLSEIDGENAVYVMEKS